MLRVKYPGRGPWVRRIAFLIVLVLPALGMAVYASAVPAQACTTQDTPNDHCYAVAIANDTTTNHGMSGDFDSSCLYVSNDGNFATQEIWDISPSGGDWEEFGLFSGAGGGNDSGNYYPDKTWYWAEQTPGNGYYEVDDPDNTPPAGTNTYYPAELTYSGGDWKFYGGNSYELLVVTGDQTAALNHGNAGTEYTSYGGNDTRDDGIISALSRESTAGDWYLWGKADQKNTGPGHYITGNYNSAAYEEWDWSC